ncbi:uncharacterized protein LOC143922652 [Arctopsyche grandis]|uniref:uncharacterized protein LOC143922652 n=1 Tax=Arctopsyche grandis TaxID=121162 RepID=UPI00406D735F
MECRLCLCSAPLDSSVSIYDDPHPLVQRIQKCCQMPVEKGDNLPDTICLVCVKNLELINTFRNVCIQSNETAKLRLVERVQIKTEEVLLEDFKWKDEERDSDFMPPIDSASEDTVDVSDRASLSVISDNTAGGDLTVNSPASTSMPHTRTRPPKRPYSNTALVTDVLKTVKEHFKCKEDRHDFYAKHVGNVLREVTKMQRIMAEKLIGEVLFEAQMGTLNKSHTLTNQ